MKEYHKIQTMFLRNPETKYKTLLNGEWAKEEFKYLKDLTWGYTEKVDGTNVRVGWDCGDGKQSFCLEFGGRTDNSQMPTCLISKLQELFPVNKFKVLYPETSMILFGEGYGAKIQKGGGNYISNGVDFILFDVMINDNYLDRCNVEDIANKLQIKVVPVLGYGTLIEAATKIQSRSFKSKLRNTDPEGIVARPLIELKNRCGKRIITKIKLKDFA